MTRSTIRWLATIGALLGVLSIEFCASAQEIGGSEKIEVIQKIDFVRDVRPIFEKHCYVCHGAEKQKSGLRLDVRSEAMRGGENYPTNLVPGQPSESTLIAFVKSQKEGERMPPEGASLSETEIATLECWVREGAVWPEGVDLVKLENRRDHWSFKQPQRQAPPVNDDRIGWARNDIDRFILQRLNLSGLAPNPEASRRVWLRRVSFDLTGLPPSPEQIEAFLADPRPDAMERVVDVLLQSPRYGERWAQHWLDVVRYADTHGFEVNTERPNAWPYRDYVIEAFNSDRPYDQFIREQIAGDAFGKDAATGFLVTASVLLPGQIGADDVSKRLARQDSIDEIVVNTGQTFLGLSIGCARCHDHKFDPITARDYYSMQAFFAGVEYLDRELHSPEAEFHKREAERLQQRLIENGTELAKYEPMAHPAVANLGIQPKKPVQPDRNEERFETSVARFVRFSIFDANLHPALGLIEPCIDEFEIFSEEEPPHGDFPASDSSPSDSPASKNVALASHGTKVTASGSNVSDRHRLEHIHDGVYGNDRSWMSNTAGTGWVLFELPEPTKIGRVVWGRDRQGIFSDRLATAYRLEIGESLESMRTVVEVPALRTMLNARINVDRFSPVNATRVRFSIHATNQLEPCLDELEVFDVQGQNVALASRGATVRSSGDSISPDRHELRFVHDGIYGNSRSWMSSEDGKGWLEVTFAKPEQIDRVVWGRDREGNYQDRLPVDYSIEIQDQQNAWRTVADSSDRIPFDPSAKNDTNAKSSMAARRVLGLSSEEAERVQQLLVERKSIEEKIVAAKQAQLAFIGNFRKPDNIYLLNRGDPEQPKEELSPAVLSVLGGKQWGKETSEQQRRIEIANWIACSENPLTARVMVNRIWQGHFGMGLVETASDFGRMGTKPSHPELLDWLATEFVASGWSVKQMHRLIVLSSTYRQASNWNPEAAAIDADARLLWRFPSRRLEAEAIRDTFLWLSGGLDFKMYGRGFDLFDKRGGLSGFVPVESFRGDGLRRMIYAHKVRRERDAVFGAFDCPDAGQSTARRRDSTTPIQALNLFNSRFTIEQSAGFAVRVEREAGSDLGKQVERAYQLALGREPIDEEREEGVGIVQQHGLQSLCRALLNCNEFLFLP